MYRQPLDTEGLSTDEGKMGRMPDDCRKRAIETMKTQVIEGLQASMRSGHTRELLDHFSAKISVEVEQGIVKMFEFAESLDRPVSEMSSSSRMQGISKRGMAQPTKKKR
jgi:hypothetical protein